ncbi:Cache domain-containing protein, partial [Leptolyngbya cf. ectocarpi LEGE 11479]
LCKPGPIGTLKKWLHLNSFGGRLFWMIMLGALVGMGGMAFLFSEMLKRQAKDQVRSNIDSKVNAISSVTDSAETLAYSLGVSATTLHDRGAQYPDTYRELILQLFERRPEFVVGLGLGQSEKGIIEEQPWLFPYYSARSAADSSGLDPAVVRYEDFADDEGEFYPESQRYQDYFVPQVSLWTEPYPVDKSRLLTYYYPLFDQEGHWLGTTLVDVDATYLSNLLDDAVFQQAGNFLLLTRSGQLIADPTTLSPQVQTYQNIPALEPIWNQIDEPSGFLRGKTGYWAYATVPGQDWLLFGFVPHQAVYGRIIRIAALTTGLMGLLLAVVVFLAIRKLNQRIKPILLQGNQFARESDLLLASLGQQDELEQLSLSFFNILEQLNRHQETIHHHEETIAQSNLHADQVTEKFLAFTAQIDEEAREQQVLIQKLQQQLHAQSDQYQSVNDRLDALFTLAQTLGGFLESLPSETESAQLFDSLDQRILDLTAILDNAPQTDKPKSQALITQLITDVANLKASDRQRHSLEKLQHQTHYLTRTRQTTLAKSQAMMTAAQTITQILVEIEAITDTFNRDAKQVSEILWEDLQQPDIAILNEPLANLDLEDELQQWETQA